MNANLMNNTIEMTKTESIAAGKLNSEKFNEYKALREMYPTFTLAIVKSAKKGDHFKGLTFDYMASYIKAHNETLIAEFYTLCGKDDEGNKIEMAAAATYGEIKMWFLQSFPEIEQKADKVNDIIEKARMARTAKKAA